jgi:hypothetical protein
MIYVIFNRERYPEDREHFFVEGPASFEAFFREKLVPWQQETIRDCPDKADFAVHKLVLVTESARFPDSFWGPIKPISVASYLAKNVFPTEDELSRRMFLPLGAMAVSDKP